MTVQHLHAAGDVVGYSEAEGTALATDDVDEVARRGGLMHVTGDDAREGAVGLAVHQCQQFVRCVKLCELPRGNFERLI